MNVPYRTVLPIPVPFKMQEKKKDPIGVRVFSFLFTLDHDVSFSSDYADGNGKEVVHVCVQCNVIVTLCLFFWGFRSGVCLLLFPLFVVCDDSLVFGIQTEADGRG